MRRDGARRSVTMTGAPRLVLLFAIATLAIRHAQAPADGPPTQTEPPAFHIGVDAVRIDAVVTDSKGQVVTDLTADDFELKDDGRPQKVTLATFVPVASGPATAELGSHALVTAGGAPPPSVHPLAPGEVQRSIVVLADDLGLSWESFLPTRKALHTFIDESLQPTDLVALIRTGMHAGMQRQFTTDRRLLHAAVDELRWTALSRRGVEPFESIEGTGLTDVGPGGSGSGRTVDMATAAKLSDVKEIVSALATLSATNLTVRAMASLPGRKAIVLVSEGFRLHQGLEIDPRIQAALDALWDQAARAGVVIYTLEPDGLQSGGLLASDNTSKLLDEAAVRGAAADRHDALRSTQDSLGLIARETGGFAVMDTNGMAHGLQRIVDDIRGFYIIGYTPDRDRFEKKGATVPGHRISVKVKRPGLRVRTHQSFIGRLEPAAPDAPATSQAALLSVAMSPFAATTMPVKLTPLWSYSAEAGASVKALLHVDTGNLMFAAGDDGRSVAAVETAGIVIDADGSVVTTRTATFSVYRQPDAVSSAGVMYSLMVPLPKPGGYQMRFAVRDTHSGAVGSVGEFVEVPDVRRGAFALSSVVVGSGASIVKALDEAAPDEDAGPAVRRFSPGAQLLYTYEVYNAVGDVETSTSVWCDGKQVFTAPPDSLDGTAERGPLRAFGSLQLDSAMSAGDYVLQIDARTGTQKKTSAATTRVDFRIK
jgi:VWFA-related protein